jgi:hypothetical protein
MRLIDYEVQKDEHGAPVVIMAIEIPLWIDSLAVPNEMRYILENLLKPKILENK